MNVAHAVLPLEEYDKLKKENESVEVFKKRLENEKLFSDRLQDAVFKLLNPFTAAQRPHDVLESCGLVCIVDFTGKKTIELAQ